MQIDILLTYFYLLAIDCSTKNDIFIGDEKVPKPSKNEPNHNPGFAKNRTKPESKNVREPKPNRTEPYPVENRTEPEPKCCGSYSVLSPNERDISNFWHITS